MKRNQELEEELRAERALNRKLTERLLLTRGEAAGNASFAFQHGRHYLKTAAN